MDPQHEIINLDDSITPESIPNVEVFFCQVVNYFLTDY